MRPRNSLKDLVIYETALRSFTADASSGLPEEQRGTFLGVGAKVRWRGAGGVGEERRRPRWGGEGGEGREGREPLFVPQEQRGTLLGVGTKGRGRGGAKVRGEAGTGRWGGGAGEGERGGRRGGRRWWGP